MLLLENRTQIQETPAREVDATKRVQVVACPRPFSMAKTITYVREGMTIREILDAIGVRFHPGIECRVFINDLLVPEWWWDRVRPKAGALFGVRVVPAGGDDGGKKNGVLMAVVAIVAVVAAVFTAGLSLAAMNVTWATATAGQAAIAAGAGALAGAAVSFAGALAVNAIAPPPEPELGQLSGSGGAIRSSNTLFLRGTRNQSNPFGVIPKVLGRHRIIPPYGQEPFTLDKDEQYMRALFVLGYGPVTIDSLRIGEADIKRFNDLEYEMVFGFPDDPPIRLIPDQIREQDLSILLKEDESNVRTTAPDCDVISVDVHLPRGVVRITEEGEYKKIKVRFLIEFAVAGTGNWKPKTEDDDDDGIETIEDNDTKPKTKNYQWRVPRGRYDVRVTRLNKNVERKDEHVFDEIWWIKLRSETREPPVNKREMAMVAINVRATEQLNGIIDEFNCVAWSCLPDLGAYELRFDGFQEHLRAMYGSQGRRNRRRARQDDPQPNVTGDDPRTYEWWMLTETDIGDEAGVFEDGHGNGKGQDFCFRLLDKDDERWGVDVGGTVYDFTVAGSIDGQWHHWAITYDGDELYVYFDGDDVANWSSVTLDTHADRMRIAEVDDVRFRGRIKDFRKWDVARTEQEIADHMNDVFTGMPGETIPEGIISLYPMHEGRGNWCLDLGPRRNHLQLMNSPSWHDMSETVDEYWALRPTSNPASCFRAILQGNFVQNPLPDSRLDLDAIGDWHKWNREQGNTLNMVLDFPSTVFDRLRTVAGAGLAGLAMPDGKYSVVIDRQQQTTVQHITPRNSWGFTSRKVFRDVPTALRVRFVDETVDWQQDERIIYDDGHDENTDNVFESLELPGVTDPDQVWRHGRHHLAVAKLRPEAYEVMMDVENLRASRGDRVSLTHDVMLVGLGSGRVKSVALDGDGKVVAVELDEELEMEEGKSYALLVRDRDTGAPIQTSIVTEAGLWKTFRLATPAVLNIHPGDLASFGIAGKVTSLCIVKSVEHFEDLTARLTLVDESPAIYSADTGEIPPWDPNITLPPDEQRRPPAPTILNIITDERALRRDGDGAFTVRAMLELAWESGTFAPPDRLQVQHRIAGSEDWHSGAWQPVQGRVLYVDDVQERLYYEFRVRSVSRLGQLSDWSGIFPAYIIGKMSPPPTIKDLYVEVLPNGMRKISWSIANQPSDYRGVRLRYKAGSENDWSAMTDLGESLFQAPVETSRPLGAGLYTFAAKAVDYSGNESEAAAFYEIALGFPPMGDLSLFISARELGWPGLIQNTAGTEDGKAAYVRDGVIYTGWDKTWDDLETDVTTWADLESADQQWGNQGFRYTHPNYKTPESIDLGKSMTFLPICQYQTRGYADGSVPKINFDTLVVIEVRVSDDDVNWGSWLDINGFGFGAQTGRYVQFRITLEHQVADQLLDFTMAIRETT